MSDRIDQLETFVAVAEAGSLSRAAQQMRVGVSVVSRRLQALEDRLGADLVRRTTRSMTLTEAGRGLHERLLQVLADLREAEEQASGHAGIVRGRVRIAAPLTFGRLYMMPLIKELMDAHPDLQLDIDFADRQVDLVEEGFDLALRIADLNDSSLVSRSLSRSRMLIAASPDYWDRHGRPETPDDLAGHTILAFTAKQGSWVWSHPDGRRGAFALNPKMIASNGDVLLDLAVDGRGVVMEPSFILAGPICRGDLELALAEFDWGDVPMNLLWPGSRHLSRRVRIVVDHLAAALRQAPPVWEACLPLRR